jgi:archaellum component FlaC
VRKVLEQSAGTVAGTLRDKVREAALDLTNEAARASEVLDSKSSDFIERLESRINNTSTRLDTRAEDLTAILDEADRKISERASQTAQALSGHADTIVAGLENVDIRIADRTTLTTQSLSNHADAIISGLEDVDIRLGRRALEASESFTGHTDGIVAALDEADQRIIARVHQVSAELDARAGEVERRLASTVSSSAGSLNALNERLAEQVDSAAEAFEQKASNLATLLDDRTREISRILEETAMPIADRMAESGMTAATQLEEATKAATERLRRENAALVQALASRTSETLAAMESARTELETGVADLIDRLSSSNMSLGQLIDLANTNLGGVDQRLLETSNALAANSATLAENAEKATGALSTTNRILETNVHRLSDISNNTLKEVASIASRFDEHGRVLASASDLLNAAQASLSTTLEDRQSSLENLAIGLVKKSEEVEKTLRSFETLVSNAFEHVETRSADSSEKIRTTVSEVIDQATGRFADATEDMRKTAASIRAELEATRNELKRGVMELPEETRESTSKMRRAVSEQINALKELSDIVTKTGRSYDAAPAAAEARTVSLPLPPTLRPQPMPVQAPSVEAPSLRGTLETAAPMPAARPSAPAPATPAREPAQRQAGWVSDLLRRASTEETPPEPRPALHVVESLNSLSVDIARAIDHNASVELWDRYRRGERNVFTRRLYTIKGQQTFDEIRRKYQTDGDFRTAVDRYVADFEKLLQDVSKNDRDSIMTQTYLTSDTGKVYTMLAHASGRIK